MGFVSLDFGLRIFTSVEPILNSACHPASLKKGRKAIGIRDVKEYIIILKISAAVSIVLSRLLHYLVEWENLKLLTSRR